MAGLSKRKKSKEKTLLWERRSDAIRVEEVEECCFGPTIFYKIMELEWVYLGVICLLLSVTT